MPTSVLPPLREPAKVGTKISFGGGAEISDEATDFWQQVVKGFVILAAVAADKLDARRE